MKISVVIPAYNEELLLEKCLLSLQSQTRPADEIIVVDNNCTDNTAAIARSNGAIVVQELQQGIYPAACTGYDAAQGDIIARCDADSIVPREWLETIEQSFLANHSIAAITGPGTFYGTRALPGKIAQVWYMYAYFLLVGSALARWPLFGSNFALRKSTWKAIRYQVHGNRTDIHDDIDLTIHLPAGARVQFNRHMSVGISARALKLSGMKKRFAWGITSLTIHWPQHSPWRLWARRLRGR